MFLSFFGKSIDKYMKMAYNIYTTSKKIGGGRMAQIKYCISFTKEFYKKLKECAMARNVTVASYIKEAIAQRMDNERG